MKITILKKPKRVTGVKTLKVSYFQINKNII